MTYTDPPPIMITLNRKYIVFVTKILTSNFFILNYEMPYFLRIITKARYRLTYVRDVLKCV